MKDGTLYAERLKKAYAKLRKGSTAAEYPDLSDPIRCLAVGVLGTDFGEERAERQLNHAMAIMVDWNEIRVSIPLELAAAIGDLSEEGQRRCRNLIAALHAIYERENRVSLDRLQSIGRREARHFLESLKGVDEYAAAMVVLWSLGGHAVPVSNRLLDALRAAELVNPIATRAEVQAFLERNIAASQAKEFCMVMRSLAGGGRSVERSSAVKKKTRTRLHKKK